MLFFAIRTFGNGRDWDRDLRRGFYNIVTNDMTSLPSKSIPKACR